MDADCLMWVLWYCTAVPTTHSPAPQPCSRVSCDVHSLSIWCWSKSWKASLWKDTPHLPPCPAAGGWGVAPHLLLIHNLLPWDLFLCSPPRLHTLPHPKFLLSPTPIQPHQSQIFKEWSGHQGANLGCPSQHGASRSRAHNFFFCQSVGAAQSLKRNSQWH